ncbi:MAG: membrane or secreted protein [Thermogutta sp.]
MKIFLIICGLAIIFPCAGCLGGYAIAPNQQPPGISQPFAQGFDPYPEDRSAPSIDGARPPGFEHPVSEPDRVRRKPWLLNQ